MDEVDEEERVCHHSYFRSFILMPMTNCDFLRFSKRRELCLLVRALRNHDHRKAVLGCADAGAEGGRGVRSSYQLCEQN